MIGKGITASVYLLDKNNIVKIFRDVVSDKEIQAEYISAKIFEEAGVVSPKAAELWRWEFSRL